ncbi:hypothetical protein A9267_10365 [Shewanella sp. UCD-FRSSP16_17]|uniref:multiheme c-type cytochrome n=1 Tax=unclassified Shewanella TaxID=196818 RepID=UPI0007EE9C75|nr:MULTISPECIES: hypothetical protein [unclassified Shewanella]MBQ4889358.1 hypothetical protein [Shewanella sp. MMG014]OBT08118.1 hypothetical protein A9267_10365 [Shewanella sp. UCD-FRSSP16_17]
MKHLTKRRLAFVVAAAMGIAGCADDGKDGADGEDGAPGEPATPPVTEVSTVTNVEYIAHMVEEGQVTVEFNLTDEDGVAITGLENAGIYLAAKTDRGIQRSRDGSVGGSATFGGDNATEGATITEVDSGQYKLVAPMAAVQADTEGLIRLQVGGGDIADSPYIIIDKPEMTHTSTTETCYSCHVDYATSDIKHAKYVAQNIDGEVDFVGGCMVCHNNVPRDVAEDGTSLDTGGYAKNTMQKLGHINHQKFEKDFTPTNCYTCHAEPVMNTSIAGNGCSDCHTSDGSGAATVLADDFDAREFHFQSSKIGLEERKEIRANHYTTTSAPYFNPTMDEWIDHKDVAWTSGYCVDIALFDNSGETPVQLNIGEMYAAHEVVYGGAYINNYYNDSIVARVIGHGSEGYIENADGSRSVCYGALTAGYELANLSASSRITIADTNWIDSDNEYGVSFTGYSDVVDPINFEKVQDWGRRHTIDENSCTTCHNNDTNYHKSGSYGDGGLDCVACHNNGQDRTGALSGPGFGPMVHSMHWGVGNELGDKAPEANSAASLNADNCVSCHADGVSLADVPNQYMLSKAYNGGTAGVMTSPITANCFACHNSDSALSHMEQNGGELNVPSTTEWFTEGTSESCATCHDTGKSFGIDKFHNFER